MNEEKKTRVIEIGEWLGLAESFDYYIDRQEKAFENLKEIVNEMEILARFTTLRIGNLEKIVSLMLEREDLYAKHGENRKMSLETRCLR
jgi:hypothetical protein